MTNSSGPAYPKIIHACMVVLVPLFIFMTAIRVVINPLFLRVEYAMPGFPEDAYGLTRQDRLKWAPYAVDYLVNDAGIEYLGDLTFEDGSPLYNERELSHMLDVKNLVQWMIRARMVVTILILLLALAAWRLSAWPSFWRGTSTGGWVVIGLIVLLIFGVFLDFSALFTEFHRIFFTGDTWLFYYSDTLIRLFPMRFWQDAFITVGLVSVLAGLACGLGLRKFSRL